MAKGFQNINTHLHKNSIHSCSHPEIFRKTDFAGNVDSLSAPIYFSLIVETSAHLTFKKTSVFVALS